MNSKQLLGWKSNPQISSTWTGEGLNFTCRALRLKRDFQERFMSTRKEKTWEKTCLSLSLRLLIPAYIQTSLPNKAPAPKSAEFPCLKHHFLGADEWLRFIFNDREQTQIKKRGEKEVSFQLWGSTFKPQALPVKVWTSRVFWDEGEINRLGFGSTGKSQFAKFVGIVLNEQNVNLGRRTKIGSGFLCQEFGSAQGAETLWKAKCQILGMSLSNLG